MKPTYLLFSLLLLCGKFVSGQGGNTPEFVSFANRQDSLFMKNYERRDLAAYDRQLAGFLDRFNKLSAQEQKNYAGYRSSAYYNLSCIKRLWLYPLSTVPPGEQEIYQKLGPGGWRFPAAG